MNKVEDFAATVGEAVPWDSSLWVKLLAAAEKVMENPRFIAKTASRSRPSCTLRERGSPPPGYGERTRDSRNPRDWGFCPYSRCGNLFGFQLVAFPLRVFAFFYRNTRDYLSTSCPLTSPDKAVDRW